VEAGFSTPVQTGPGAHPAPCTMGTGSFPGGKEQSGHAADPSPPASAVGHERVELYLYSPYGPYGLYRASVPVQGCTLPFFYTKIFLDIWLAVHHSMTFFIITNLIHKFLVHSQKLHKIIFLYMFRAQSTHQQEVNDANCTNAASGIITLCK